MSALLMMPADGPMQQAPGRAPGPLSTLPHAGGGSALGALSDSAGGGGMSRAFGHAATGSNNNKETQRVMGSRYHQISSGRATANRGRIAAPGGGAARLRASGGAPY